MVIYIRSDARGFSYRKWQMVIEAQGSCPGSFLRDPAVPRHLSGVDPLPLQPRDLMPTTSGSSANCQGLSERSAAFK